MRRIVEAKIPVTSDDRGHPCSFTWKGRTYHIQQVVDCWKEIGEWWENATPRTVYRVLAAGQGTYELHFLEHTRTWVLYGIED